LTFISLLLLAKDVESIATQPEWIRYQLGDKWRAKLPDLMVRVAGHTIFVEIKPLARLYESKTLDSHAEFGLHMAAVGAPLVFLTDDQLPEARICENARFFRRYLNGSIAPAEEVAARDALTEQPLSIAQLLDRSGLPMRSIHTLIATRRIAPKWCEKLSEQMLVHWVGDGANGISFTDISRQGRFHRSLARLAMGHRPTDKREIAIAKIDRRITRPVRAPTIV
jgi:hypothetical protein